MFLQLTLLLSLFNNKTANLLLFSEVNMESEVKLIRNDQCRDALAPPAVKPRQSRSVSHPSVLLPAVQPVWLPAELPRLSLW